MTAPMSAGLPGLATLIAEAKRIDQTMTDAWFLNGTGYKVLARPTGVDLLVADTNHVPTAKAIAWLRNNIGLLVAHLEASEFELQVVRKERDELRADAVREDGWALSEIDRLRRVVDASIAMRSVHEGCVTEPPCGECIRCAFDQAVDTYRNTEPPEVKF